MTAEDTNPHYHAYLVRLWRDNAQAPWRASITHVATGQVHRFADPQLAWAYVAQQLEAQSAEQPGSSQ